MFSNFSTFDIALKGLRSTQGHYLNNNCSNRILVGSYQVSRHRAVGSGEEGFKMLLPYFGKLTTLVR